jgi:hypothetical protein
VLRNPSVRLGYSWSDWELRLAGAYFTVYVFDYRTFQEKAYVQVLPWGEGVQT